MKFCVFILTSNVKILPITFYIKQIHMKTLTVFFFMLYIMQLKLRMFFDFFFIFYTIISEQRGFCFMTQNTDLYFLMCFSKSKKLQPLFDTCKCFFRKIRITILMQSQATSYCTQLHFLLADFNLHILVWFLSVDQNTATLHIYTFTYALYIHLCLCTINTFCHTFFAIFILVFSKPDSL